jgi:hypothetical protein
MGIRYNPFTGNLDFTGSGITGPSSSTDKAIARWNGTTGQVVQDSPGTFVQDGGAIEASGFITENHVTTTIEIGAGQTMVVASYLDLDTGGTVIIDGDGELLIV